MTDIITGLLSDCLGAKGIPTNTVNSAIGKLMRKRHASLREIILCEIRQGNFDRVDEDELIGIFFRLIRDAEEGVAKNNLCLMARVVNGMAEKNNLKASSFLNYANILANLTEAEIIVLGTMAQLGWATFMGDRGNTECKNLGIDNMQSIQQALLRTGLVTMRIEIKASDQRENKNLGISGSEPTSEQVYTLTPLFTEIEEYIKEFSLNKNDAAA